MRRLNVLVSALILGTCVLQAQETNQIDQLKRQLQQMQENFDRVQREHKQQMDALTQKLDELAKRQSVEAEKKKLEQELAVQLAADLATNQPPGKARLGTSTVTPPVEAVTQPWSPSQPITVARAGSAYMNVSFDALVAAGASTANDIEKLETGGHDPKERGFTVQNLEITLDGKVDPYFRGQANIVLQIDPRGETTIEAEEAYLETMSLPLNLQVKAGQFFTEFGRLNPTHPHAWSFVDQPLVNGRFFGEDGLRSAGTRLSWLTPTPFYSELFFTIQNSQGGTAFSFRNDHKGELFFGRPHNQGSVKNLGDMLFVPRYAASFDLSDAQTLVAGVSAAFGPNGSGATTDTQVYGADLYWKWKSANAHAGFPFVSWQTEAMLRRYEAGAFAGDATATPPLPGVPAETLTDWGIYSQVLWGFKPRWVAGLRGDFVAPTETGAYETILGRDPDRAQRWRVSPNLTWYPSEFSKIRLQYNYDDRDRIGVDHSVWLQFEFLLGAHAAHKF
jgi:hypothetical protein